MTLPADTSYAAEPVKSRSADGMVFLTVAFVVFLLSVAASFLMPAWQQARRVSRAQAVVADLRQYETAFQAFAHDHGDWPSAAAPGTYPEGMDAALKATRWAQPSPIGGRYVWLVDTRERGQRLHAFIAIASAGDDLVSTDRRQLDELLNQAVAAKLTPHRLRLGFRNEPIYVLEN